MTLRQMRLSRGWTVKDLEHECYSHGGVSAKTIERAERGVKIDEVMAWRLARALDCETPEEIEGLNY